jgi:hypothetical protein
VLPFAPAKAMETTALTLNGDMIRLSPAEEVFSWKINFNDNYFRYETYWLLGYD